jgi:hypothetical protein
MVLQISYGNVIGVEGDGGLFCGKIDVGIDNALYLREALLDIDGATGAAHPRDGKNYPLTALLLCSLNRLFPCLRCVLINRPREIFFW